MSLRSGLAVERIRTLVVPDHDELARVVARRIADLVREKTASGATAVLGLATGSTPIGVYRELIRMHREEGLSFARVVTFNLDEYYPMDPGSLHSYHRFMWENFFSFLDIPREQVHLLRGDVSRASRMVATPIVTASRGTFSSPKKSAAASFRVTRSRVMSRVRLSSPEPGSLKPM